MPILYSRSRESVARSTAFRAFAIVVYYRGVFPGDVEKDVTKRPWRCVDIPYIVSARDRDHALEQVLADHPSFERGAEYNDRSQRAIAVMAVKDLDVKDRPDTSAFQKKVGRRTLWVMMNR
jgi:hypothetical protein